MSTNSVTLRNLRSLSGMNFFIPDYQRGYRWSSFEAEQLMNDLKEFCKRRKEEGEFYCLQPIVVKKRTWLREENGKTSEVNGYEVIDGQQRLTTLYILMKCKEQKIKALYEDFQPFSIKYETRVEFDSQKFLENIDKPTEASSEFIDFYHMRSVYDSINDWFKKSYDGKSDYDRKIIDALLSQDIEETEGGSDIDKANNVRMIWYEVSDSENSSSNDIFTRLNIGKIPLTNAELIKALLLRRGNFIESEASLKQIQISTEWNQIEQRLQDDSFWYFLYNTSSEFRYENRIEFLFDLMKHRTKDSEYYYTFNEFNRRLEDLGRDPDLQNNQARIDKIWLEVKQTFQTLEEWYEDRTLYHLIGFLIEQGEDIKDLREQSLSRSKSDFIAYIKEKIREKMGEVNLRDLTYGEKTVKKVLLLFNILTTLKSSQSSSRFPFGRYKKEKWDIEHITSQTEINIHDDKKRKEWIKDMFVYFTGKEDISAVQNYLEKLINKIKKGPYESPTTAKERSEAKILKALLSLVCDPEPRVNVEEFEKTFRQVQSYFSEDEVRDKNNISNLALLDAQTNRGYKNSFFPVKREWIIRKDRQGIFVPIGIKNVFLKYYSPKSNNMLRWGNEDAENYLSAIEREIADYVEGDKNVGN